MLSLHTRSLPLSHIQTQAHIIHTPLLSIFAHSFKYFSHSPSAGSYSIQMSMSDSVEERFSNSDSEAPTSPKPSSSQSNNFLPQDTDDQNSTPFGSPGNATQPVPATTLTPGLQQLASSPSKRPFDMVFRTPEAKRTLVLTPSQR